MDLRKLKKLIDLVQESGIAELEVTEGEEKVRISRVTQGLAPQFLTMSAAAPALAQAGVPAAAVAGVVMALGPRATYAPFWLPLGATNGAGLGQAGVAPGGVGTVAVRAVGVNAVVERSAGGRSTIGAA